MNVIEQLTQVIGEESALLLGNYMGGARLYIPVKVQHDHPITMLLGREKSQMLSDYFKGDTIDIEL
ncbi:hypothetical protein [Algicola sagamiensis]|uniref:hypothetical protein n=1 Tax=Algicola sagamiensis TaxID=163869 RepID=UPI000381B40D|nr:hypothetical protein [Algicola sagamiensis]